MNLISILPYVDVYLAIKILDQFPEFAKTSLEIINTMKNLFDNFGKESSINVRLSIETYIGSR